jgi:hypothetical protein
MSYKKIKTILVYGKKKCIYMKPKGTREYVKSKGDFVLLSVYIKRVAKIAEKKLVKIKNGKKKLRGGEGELSLPRAPCERENTGSINLYSGEYYDSKLIIIKKIKKIIEQRDGGICIIQRDGGRKKHYKIDEKGEINLIIDPKEKRVPKQGTYLFYDYDKGYDYYIDCDVFNKDLVEKDDIIYRELNECDIKNREGIKKLLIDFNRLLKENSNKQKLKLLIYTPGAGYVEVCPAKELRINSFITSLKPVQSSSKVLNKEPVVSADVNDPRFSNLLEQRANILKSSKSKISESLRKLFTSSRA